MWEVLGHRKYFLFRVSVRVRFAALNLELQNGESHSAEHTLHNYCKSVRCPACPVRILILVSCVYQE